MSKKLILQSPAAGQAALAHIAALANPQSTTPIHAHALRCDGFAFTPALKAQVEAAPTRPASTPPSSTPTGPWPISGWWRWTWTRP